MANLTSANSVNTTNLSPAELGKVAVLYGGNNSEREVSIKSGTMVHRALASLGVDAHLFDPSQRDLTALKHEGFTRAFIALHGRFGEDGTLQGVLEYLRIPYTGSGVAASALGMDKQRTKLCWIAEGIPTPRYAMLKPNADWKAVVAKVGYPLIVKPVHEGSTIGVTRVMSVDNNEVQQAYEAAAAHDPTVIAEELIEGPELTVAILDGKALPIIRIEAPSGNYDYEHKYLTNDTKYHCPAGLAPELESRIQAAAEQAFAVVGCSGWGRLDVMMRTVGGKSEFYFLEVNTSPGMTDHSLVPKAAAAVGIDYPQLCLRILQGARLHT
jgi:D-alanine-D-alanine ligase